CMQLSREERRGRRSEIFLRDTEKLDREGIHRLVIASAPCLVREGVEAERVEHAIERRRDFVRDVVPAPCVELRLAQIDVARRNLCRFADEATERSDERPCEDHADDEGEK